MGVSGNLIGNLIACVARHRAPEQFFNLEHQLALPAGATAAGQNGSWARGRNLTANTMPMFTNRLKELSRAA